MSEKKFPSRRVIHESLLLYQKGGKNDRGRKVGIRIRSERVWAFGRDIEKERVVGFFTATPKNRKGMSRGGGRGRKKNMDRNLKKKDERSLEQKGKKEVKGIFKLRKFTSRRSLTKTRSFR